LPDDVAEPRPVDVDAERHRLADLRVGTEPRSVGDGDLGLRVHDLRDDLHRVRHPYDIRTLDHGTEDRRPRTRQQQQRRPGYTAKDAAACVRLTGGEFDEQELELTHETAGRDLLPVQDYGCLPGPLPHLRPERRQASLPRRGGPTRGA
jgi:hypothetical protein